MTVLVAAGLTALLAQGAAQSIETITFYGLVKPVSDLLWIIGAIWLVVGLVRVVRPARPRA